MFRNIDGHRIFEVLDRIESLLDRVHGTVVTVLIVLGYIVIWTFIHSANADEKVALT